jgi:hypothetical protein
MNKKNENNFYKIFTHILEFLVIFPDFSSQKNDLFEYFWYLFAILSTFQTRGNFFGIF